MRRRTLLGLGGLAVTLPAWSGCAATTAAAPASTVRPSRLGERFTFRSVHRLGSRVSWTLLTPVGRPPAGLPALLCLHGKGGDHTSFDYLQPALDEREAAGGAPLAVLAADAGNTYYHRRASGEDSLAMLVDELLPAAAERGVATNRIALLGMSMGGYGSLLMASRLGPDRVAAVAAMSSALWQQSPDYSPGAFDSADDHARHNLFGKQQQLDGIAVRVDCGRSDPFIDANRAYVDGFDTPPEHSFTRGGHNHTYWSSLAAEQLRFIGANLTG